jgi:hypothetical protein
MLLMALFTPILASGEAAMPSSAPVPTSVTPLFVGLDLAALPPQERQIFLQASEDFRAVAAGKKPIHAKVDASAPLPADGGTTFYKGLRYSLTVVQDLSDFGAFSGMVYGPVLTFDPEFAPGNSRTLSDVRGYSLPEFRRLQKGKIP